LQADRASLIAPVREVYKCEHGRALVLGVEPVIKRAAFIALCNLNSGFALVLPFCKFLVQVSIRPVRMFMDNFQSRWTFRIGSKILIQIGNIKAKIKNRKAFIFVGSLYITHRDLTEE